MNAASSRTLIVAIKAYRYFISPLFGQHCRFHPSCSAYAIEAIERFGAIRGIWLAGHRLLRCQPFSEGGLDPVPASCSSRGEECTGTRSDPTSVRGTR
ncbi:MAG TPA: membrane protein insertion efficiency factor YidD [Pseudomonadales bacterium]